jgi:hypothetical protein
MMRIRRAAAADQTRLLGNQFNVIAIANPARRRQRQHCFIYDSDPPLSFASNRSQSRRSSFLRHRQAI